MVDLSLDLNPASPTYRDLLISNNDMVLTSDAPNSPNGTNPVQQNILQELAFGLGEWSLDNTQGTPWIQQILVKNPNISKIDAILINKILGVPGVIQLNAYSFTQTPGQRNGKISFRALTTSGVVDYSGNILPSGGT